MTVSEPHLRLSWEETLARLVNWSSCGSAAGGHAGKTARIVADYLRHGLCHFERKNAKKTHAVHFHQLLSGLRRQLSELLPAQDVPPWFSPEDARPAAIDDEPDAAALFGIKDLGLHILRKLILLGDCGHLGSGFYVATPTRLVFLPSGAALVIGGLPTANIAADLGIQPGWAGLARAVAADRVGGVRPGIPHINLPGWAGIPEEPLATWTAHLLDEASKNAEASAGPADSSFEIYAPYLQRNKGQRARWVASASWRRPQEIAAESLDLCRTRNRPYRYWLAPLIKDHHGVRYRRQWPVRPEWSRRLMYGIDERYGLTVVGTLSTVQGSLSGNLEVQLDNWPAAPEYRAISALGCDSTPAYVAQLPIRFRVGREWWPDVRAVLAGLSIRIREKR